MLKLSPAQRRVHSNLHPTKAWEIHPIKQRVER